MKTDKQPESESSACSDWLCQDCGTVMKLSSGWVPTYNNPDNGGSAPPAEPYCPKCVRRSEAE